MRLFNSVTAIVAVLTVELVTASPVDTAATSLEKRKEVPCEPAGKYTTKWFVENVKVRPEVNKCLFYSRGLSVAAQGKCRTRNSPYISIWNIWDCGLYDMSSKDTNPMRCIIKKDADGALSRVTTNYFKAMSAAMAELCGGKVSSIHENPHDIDKGGIFWTVEKPKLTGNRNGLPKVTSLVATDVNFRNEVELWKAPRKRDLNGTMIVERDVGEVQIEEVQGNVFDKRTDCPNVDPAFEKIW